MPMLEGRTFNLMPQQGIPVIYPGTQTQILRYNDAMPGKNLVLKKGQAVTLNVHKQFGDTDTTHWHSLYLSPANDGSPHTPILAGDGWSLTFKILDNAANY
ncbi:MAG: multicopper oxidase domain-containing protein [Saprospiraceae bacterium]|nr:multicopper oxidase domain-containing protein [Saprospiraceae bacterium]